MWKQHLSNYKQRISAMPLDKKRELVGKIHTDFASRLMDDELLEEKILENHLNPQFFFEDLEKINIDSLSENGHVFWSDELNNWLPNPFHPQLATLDILSADAKLSEKEILMERLRPIWAMQDFIETVKAMMTQALGGKILSQISKSLLKLLEGKFFPLNDDKNRFERKLSFWIAQVVQSNLIPSLTDSSEKAEYNVERLLKLEDYNAFIHFISENWAQTEDNKLRRQILAFLKENSGKKLNLTSMAIEIASLEMPWREKAELPEEFSFAPFWNKVDRITGYISYDLNFMGLVSTLTEDGMEYVKTHNFNLEVEDNFAEIQIQSDFIVYSPLLSLSYNSALRLFHLPNKERGEYLCRYLIEKPYFIDRQYRSLGLFELIHSNFSTKIPPSVNYHLNMWDKEVCKIKLGENAILLSLDTDDEKEWLRDNEERLSEALKIDDSTYLLNQSLWSEIVCASPLTDYQVIDYRQEDLPLFEIKDSKVDRNRQIFFASSLIENKLKDKIKFPIDIEDLCVYSSDELYWDKTDFIAFLSRHLINKLSNQQRFMIDLAYSGLEREMSVKSALLLDTKDDRFSEILFPYLLSEKINFEQITETKVLIENTHLEKIEKLCKEFAINLEKNL